MTMSWSRLIVRLRSVPWDDQRQAGPTTAVQVKRMNKKRQDDDMCTCTGSVTCSHGEVSLGLPAKLA